jgi:hypothetical protein
MNLTETTGCLTWISQVDGRIQLTEPNVQIWANALAPVMAAEAREAILEHYRTNETAVTPAGIRKASLAIRDRAVAKQAALTAGPTKPERSYDEYVKHMQRPEFKAAFDRGVAERLAQFPKGATK